MIKVYTPHITVDCFADWFGFTNVDFERCTDLSEVLAQDIKIACVPAFYNNYTDAFDHTLFDLLLLTEIENWDVGQVRLWAEEKGIKNYLAAMCSIESPVDRPNEIYRPWWCFNLVNKNTFQESAVEPMFDFDVLLGARKCHRDFVMANLQTKGLLDRSIVNYRDVFRGGFMEIDSVQQRTNELLNGQPLLYPYVSPNLDPAWEVREEITYNVSDIVPWQIFHRTRYSVITETIFQYSFFFTEKTTKAIFAKRLFVVFSSKGYLQRLRNLGFKTFSDVIDESYDNEEDPLIRFTKAFEQIEFLSKQDYNIVNSKISSTVEHNHQRLFTLQKEIKDQMQQMVYNKLKEIKDANSLQ